MSLKENLSGYLLFLPHEWCQVLQFVCHLPWQSSVMKCIIDFLVFQDPEEKQLILPAAAVANDVMMTADQQQEEILANFDSFLKLAGTELVSVRDMAKNMTGMVREYIYRE